MRLTALLLVVAEVAGGCSLGDDERAAGDGQASDGLRVSTSEWETDFAKHSVPLAEFQSGGPGRDGIPPIDDPKPISQAEAEDFLDDREPVLAVEERDAVRAYPIQILIWHEIVNDELGGRPIAVTYCPLCNSSVVLDRRVDGRELTFGTTGNLRKSDLVMWDRQTESWWQQRTADAVVGELTGARLEVLASQTLSRGDFKRFHPDGDVLSRDTGNDRPYGTNPYEGYDQPAGQPFLLNEKGDEALPARERVAAVFADDDVVVVPFSRLAREPVVNEQVGREPVVFLYERGVVSPLDAPRITDSRDVGTATAYGRSVGGRELEFERRGGMIVDRQTGSEWDITGRAVAGELRGRRLPQVRHDEQFWFALAAFLPDAKIAGLGR